MKYAIGLDFGTASVRAVAVDCRNGEVAGSTGCEYGVYSVLPGTGASLKPKMALADPAEYLEAMTHAVRDLLSQTQIDPEAIVAIGADTTSCTVVALDDRGQPLSSLEAFKENPHAYMKLWKSRSAQREADELYQAAKQRGEAFLPWAGDKVSSEWMLPKTLETFREAPEVFANTRYFMDLADYIPYLLTGQVTRNMGSCAFKVMGNGGVLPSADYLESVQEGFGAVLPKLAGRVIRWGDKAGELTAKMADRLGLRPGITVGCGALDGNIPYVTLGLHEEGDMLLTLGTSGVLAMQSAKAIPVSGLSGGGIDAFMAGYYACEAGLAAMGDLYGWAVDEIMPARWQALAQQQGVSPHEAVSQQVLTRPPRLEDPLALDWWNGHRGPLPRSDVQGVLVGMTLATRWEDLYRAVVEATAFCVRMNIDNLETQGLQVGRIAVCGGIARKNPQLVRLVCDVLGRPLYFADKPYEAAVGAAIIACHAHEQNDALTLPETQQRMAASFDRTYTPDLSRKPVFDQRYERYVKLAHIMQEF